MTFEDTLAFYGGGLMGIKCVGCYFTFDNCNFTQSAVTAMNLGSGIMNDGGYFYIGSITSFTVINSVF